MPWYSVQAEFSDPTTTSCILDACLRGVTAAAASATRPSLISVPRRPIVIDNWAVW
ncbi:hypothetical protein SNOG_12672 [Parastagonospora nodorum SN15]|uniref:Uncharacterized protein n=1 Tax=Phaeosphaeria nodorum (strain SN15 / ATCC MYA-4574 / FGSC 10173) TaxID=321614 RepID=Q0U6E2_PHANO|nr:hypothetical protein SNOG_12672 [Parastagonospora nodorum SN15]EAT79970.1 hypothetical protein SNOG_12672 [Parastagonospora nodorum SN15]